MNCKAVQELLPLYVSRDLDEDRVQLITSHLHSCAACAGSAHEYVETRDLLQEFAAPVFNDAVYSGIRESVWREIEKEAESRPASLTQLFTSIFRPRVRWAMVSALLLAAALVAFYFIANRNEQRQIAGSPPLGSPQKIAAAVPALPENVPTTQRIHRPQPKMRALRAADRAPAVAENRNQQPSGSTEAALESNKLAEPGAVQSSEKVFRLEMQTKDPNIRIIWLTPQRIKHESPGKISKGV
jgi:hypothetical protein